MSDLRSCSFCGDTRAMLIGSLDVPPTYNVLCQTCGAQGPVRLQPEHAHAAWQQRASHAVRLEVGAKFQHRFTGEVIEITGISFYPDDRETQVTCSSIWAFMDKRATVELPASRFLHQYVPCDAELA